MKSIGLFSDTHSFLPHSIFDFFKDCDEVWHAGARRSDARHDIPRIDMHYFRVERAWRNFLEGGRVYFRARQALRMVGQAVRG